MNKTHRFILIASPILILVAILGFLAFKTSAGVMERGLPNTGAQASIRSNVGMGDLRRFEAQQSLPSTRAEASSSSYVGMGDLRRFEAQQSLSSIGTQASNRNNIGMGDLRRFEGQQ